jgi:hypothetical protein
MFNFMGGAVCALSFLLKIKIEQSEARKSRVHVSRVAPKKAEIFK